MKVVRLTSGLLTHRLTESEQNLLWNKINTDTSPVGKHGLFTPQDNIEYFIISEKELGDDKLELSIKTNNKVLKVRCTIYNQDEKINKAVRKANS